MEIKLDKPIKFTTSPSRQSRAFPIRSPLAFFTMFTSSLLRNENEWEGYKINKPLSGLLLCRVIMSLAERLSSKFHICPRSFASPAAKCSFFGQSPSRGHYQPTYQPSPFGRKYARILVHRSEQFSESFEGQIMSKDKYPSIFSPEMEAIVFIILQIFYATRSFENWGIFSDWGDISQC